MRVLSCHFLRCPLKGLCSLFSVCSELGLPAVCCQTTFYLRIANMNQQRHLYQIQICSLISVRTVAKNLQMMKTDKLGLDMFFSCKTHKDGMPFRVIILQKREKFDVKNLYYSLCNNTFLEFVEQSILEHDAVAFQVCQCRVYLYLLALYWTSIFVHWNTYIQKQVICIGLAIAPVLSDIFMAHLDRTIAQKFLGTKVLQMFRFVDYCLIVLKCDAKEFQSFF